MTSALDCLPVTLKEQGSGNSLRGGHKMDSIGMAVAKKKNGVIFWPDIYMMGDGLVKNGF